MDNLGRLVAADRNARAAIDLARSVAARAGVLHEELRKANKQIAILQEQITALQQRQATMAGNGPTQR